MTPVGKIMKLLLALTAAGAVAMGMSGCKKDETRAPSPAPAQEKAPHAASPAKPAGEAAAPANGAQVVEIKVTANGYEPSPVALKKGVPVTLKVTRTTDETCATDIHIDEYNIHEKLPLNQAVAITFTPDKSGELRYGCGMGKMVSGKFFVE